MSLYYRCHKTYITLTGQTYPHRESIKKMGGQFIGDRKIWQVPFSETTKEEIHKLCLGVGGGALDQEKEEKPLFLDSQPFTTSLTLPLESTSIKSKEILKIPEEELVFFQPPKNTDYGILQLMQEIEGSVKEKFSRPLWIVGEVENLSIRDQGVFFHLAEAGSRQGTVSVSVIMWQSVRSKLAKEIQLQEILQEGLKIRCLVEVQFYKNRGQVSLQLLSIDPAFTKGALALEREKLLKELRAKNLDQANKKLPLSLFPFRVGLITAENSRAFSDFTHQLTEGGFGGEILFYASAMQGEKTTGEVLAGLEVLTQKNCDVIVITRGGGGASDLRWFDHPKLAYSIALSKIPIICAIGHHDDFCIAEEICFNKQKTPTAAADFLLMWFASTKERILLAAETMRDRWTRAQLKHERNQQFLAQNLALRAQAKIEGMLSLLLRRQRDLFISSMQSIAKFEQNWHQKNTVFATFDPKPWLVKGWTQLRFGDKLLKSIDDVQIGEKVVASLQDGNLEFHVDAKRKVSLNK